LAKMLNTKGEQVQIAPGSGHRVKIPLARNMEHAFVARFF
jgi:putative protease